MFAISVFAGALIRRVVAAIAAWSGLFLVVVYFLRRHYQGPRKCGSEPR